MIMFGDSWVEFILWMVALGVLANVDNIILLWPYKKKHLKSKQP